jgi:hypothetical protein
MITLSARMSCRRLGNTWACLENRRASLQVIASKPPFISMARRVPWDACQHRSPPLRQVRSGAEGRVSAPDPSLAVRRGPVLRDTRQRRTPPGWRGVVWSLWARGSTGDLLGGGEGSEALDTWQRRGLSKQGGGFQCRSGTW